MIDMGFRVHGFTDEQIKRFFSFENGDDVLRIYVQDGQHENPFDGSNMSTLELAKMLHNGAYNIPARPFMEDFITENADFCYTQLQNAVEFIGMQTGELRYDQPAFRVSYRSAGERIKKALKEFMTTYYKDRAPNAPYTVSKKGFNQPLFLTGQLRESIHWTVL